MKFVIALIAAIALVQVASAATGEWGRADIFMLNPTNGALAENSYALFETINSTHTRVTVHIEGIPSGLGDNAEHGIHIHTYGDMSDPSGASLGGHWNWNNVAHGCGEARSAGDLGNFTAVSGTIDETREYDLLALTGSNSIIGRAIVLHRNPDDCANVASSGPRIAAGVIGIQNVTGAGNVNSATVATSFGAGPYSATCVIQPTTMYGAGLAGIFSWNQTSAGGPTAVNGWINKNLTCGVHVHKFGDLSDRAKALATSTHYDPQATGAHGLPTAGFAHHAGDMGNTNTDNFDGTVLSYSDTFSYQTLEGLNSVIGHGFVVHLLPDDGTGTTGNAGNRQGQCVVGLAAAPPATPPTVAPEAPVAPVAPTTPPPTDNTPSAASSLTFSVAIVALLAVSALFM